MSETNPSPESESTHKFIRLLAKLKELTLGAWPRIKSLLSQLLDLARREPVVLRAVIPPILALGIFGLTDAEVSAWTGIIVAALALIGGLSARGKVRPVKTKEQQEDLAQSVKAITKEVANLRAERKITTEFHDDIDFSDLQRKAKEEGGLNVKKGTIVRAKSGVPEHADFALFQAITSFRLGSNPRRPYKDSDHWEMVKVLKADPRGEEIPAWDEVVAKMRADEKRDLARS